MSESQWTQYDEISDRAYLQIIQGKNGKFYLVDREDTMPVHGPFETPEAAALYLIEHACPVREGVTA